MQEEDCEEFPGLRVPAVWFFSRSVSPRAAWSCRLGGLRKSGEPGWETSRGGFGLSACIRQQTRGAAGELRFPVAI